MAKLIIGLAVFVAVFCGQPAALGALSLYLAIVLVCASLTASFFSPSRPS